MTPAKKSNVIRLLESRHISHRVYTYSTDMRSAEDVAQEVYKTLVVLAPHGEPLLVIIPGPCVLDLKRLALALGEKKLRMASHREAEALTGLQVGGISALALQDRRFQVYVEQAAQELTEFVVSAGQRGMNVRLRVDDFMRVTKARFVQASLGS